MDTEILQAFDLSPREIAVYQALLKLGSTTTGPLVHESKVQNAKIYETLDKLMQKGLVSYIYIKKTKVFQAADPKILTNLFNEKYRKLQETIDHLSSIKKPNEIYEARVYKGIRAIKAAFFELYEKLGKNGKYCVFPIGDQLAKKELKLFWSQVLHKQRSLNIKIQTLPNEKWYDIFENHYKHYPNLNVRYTKQEFPTGIFIFPDSVLNVVWKKEPIAFLLIAKEHAEKWQTFFNQQWKISKPKLKRK